MCSDLTARVYPESRWRFDSGFPSSESTIRYVLLAFLVFPPPEVIGRFAPLDSSLLTIYCKLAPFPDQLELLLFFHLFTPLLFPPNLLRVRAGIFFRDGGLRALQDLRPLKL